MNANYVYIIYDMYLYLYLDYFVGTGVVDEYVDGDIVFDGVGMYMPNIEHHHGLTIYIIYM